MNIEFRVHGTLKGQAYWSATGADTATDSDYEYCARSYDSREESPSMDVEVVKRSDGGFCTYYTYLRSKNIVSTRPKAYFGMTVRIDNCICRDVVTMYALLEMIFKKYMVGTLFTLEKDNAYHYNIYDSFAEKDAELKFIEQTFGRLFESILATDIVPISSYKYKKINQICPRNNEDLDNNEAYEILLKGYRLCVSPTYLTKQAQNEQAQLNAKAQNEWNNVKNGYETTIRNLTMENENLQTEKNNKQNEIDSLHTEVESYTKLYGKIKFHVESLNVLLDKPVINSSEGNSSENSDTSSGSSSSANSGSKIDFHSFFSSKKRLAAVVVIFAVILFVAGNAFYNIIKMNVGQNENLKNLMDVQWNSEPSRDSSASINENVNYSTLEIDIYEKNTSDSELKQGKTYTFEIKGEEKTLFEGTWYVNGSKLIDNIYYVSDRVGNTLSIEYRGNNGEKIGPRKVLVIK